MSVQSYWFDWAELELYSSTQTPPDDWSDASSWFYSIMSMHDLGDDQVMYLCAEKLFSSDLFNLNLCILNRSDYKSFKLTAELISQIADEKFWCCDYTEIVGKHPMKTMFLVKEALAEIEAEVQALANKDNQDYQICIDALDKKRYKAYVRVASKLGYTAGDKKSMYVENAPLYFKKFTPCKEA